MDFLAVNTTPCYFMDLNFYISLFFPEKNEGRKRKTKKNNNNCPPPKKPLDYFGLLVKRF